MRSTFPPATPPRAEGGTEFLQFSPSEELKIVEAAIFLGRKLHSRTQLWAQTGTETCLLGR